MKALDAEHRAWRILVASFISFVLLCVGLLYGIQWFVFQSTVQMEVTITATRGTVRVTRPSIQDAWSVTDDPQAISTGSTIQTDPTSQAVVSFFDVDTGRPLAYLFVMRDSRVRLRQAQIPRFSVNKAPNSIEVHNESGKTYMVIVGDQKRPIQFKLTSPHGAVTTTQPGQYAAEVTDNWTKVSVQNGEALLTSDRDDSALHLSNNQHAYLAKANQSSQHPAIDRSLVVNNQFTEIYSAGWKAYNIGEPAGIVASEDFQGRPVVTINRGRERWPSLILDHGDTGLVQEINTDVSSVDSLELQASFYVDEQSLSTCGVAGSECPLMIRVDYTDPAGEDRFYIHGFFAYHDQSAGYPLLCDTCRAEHERVRLQSWYTYSDNLLALLPPDQRPQFVKQIRVYASGHAYVVHIAQMDLVASRLRPPGQKAQ